MLDLLHPQLVRLDVLEVELPLPHQVLMHPLTVLSRTGEPARYRSLIEPEAPEERNLVVHALRNSDERIAQGKPVTPAFLYAAMLWPALEKRQRELQEDAQLPELAAMHEPIPELVAEQCRSTTIPRRFSTPMREIWELHQRLIARRSQQKLAAHPRFRAAYDFSLLREQSGESLDGAGEWWTRFQSGEPLPAPSSEARPCRRRRRRGGSGRRQDGA